MSSPRGHYCLRCFAHLPEQQNRCEQCDFVSTSQLRKLFWNRNPRLHMLQRVLQFLGLALTLAACTWIAFRVRFSGGGYAIFAPLFFFAAVHYTAEKLNRHMVNFRPGVLWSAACFLGAGIAFLFGLGQSSLRMGIELFILAGVLTVAGLSILALARRLERWQRKLMHGEPSDPDATEFTPKPR